MIATSVAEAIAIHDSRAPLAAIVAAYIATPNNIHIFHSMNDALHAAGVDLSAVNAAADALIDILYPPVTVRGH